MLHVPEPMQPKFTTVLATILVHVRGTLPWSVLLLREPRLQYGSQTLHPDSNQVLGDTEMLAAVNRGRTHTQASLANACDEWQGGTAA